MKHDFVDYCMAFFCVTAGIAVLLMSVTTLLNGCTKL
jgi:hypothetical protein